MDVNSSVPPSNTNEVEGTIARPLADFPPTVWGEFFIHSLASENQIIDHTQMQQRVEELKEEVRAMFSEVARDRGHRLKEEMNLVDALQRLGLAYHFEKEISEALPRIHGTQILIENNDDLQAISLRFRLLRQGGYNISSDEFNKLKDVQGHFRGSLSSDINGLLSLYEASYLATQEDVILDEAMSFCRRELESMLDRLKPPLAAEVARALETPLIRRIQRLEARQYLSFYEAKEGRNDLILELAKLDFNHLQSLHQEEIRNLTRWWEELGLIKQLSFARDRLVECYLWFAGIRYEPHFARVRIVMTKVISLLSIQDDIYDAYGTLEELQLLTYVMQRWDIGEAEGLPLYMRTYFTALTNTFMEFEDELLGEQKSYCMQYLKQEFKALARAYLKEAEWCNEGHIPMFKDHLHISLTTSVTSLLTCAILLCMGDIATKDAFDWLTSNPKIVEASAIISRLTNDIIAHEFEEKRQHVASTVRCYMKEYGVSEEMACQKLREMADIAWKVMNEEWIELTQMPLQLLAIPFDLGRVIEMYYKNTDGYTHSFGGTKDVINLLLVNRIPL